jgi:sigma-54-interacting transcriptional regulator
MERALKAFAGATQVIQPLNPSVTLPDDCRLARAVRANLLIVYRGEIGRQTLDALLKEMYHPVATWQAGLPLALPRVAPAGTIVLHDISALRPPDQSRLLAWLDAARGRTQVVSTTSTPLLTRVQTGTFDETLYYRLNTVCVDLA